jgi:CRISPR-associated protein Csb2
VSVTVAIRFPLGRYHATPWDRSVNEGAVEWPPSPWRLLRTLVATWYTRWPELPAPVLDGLLDALGEPPAYRTPPVRAGHSRHYLPDLNHRKGETGATDLTLDPYLSVAHEAELLVRWQASLTADQREVLAKLLELVPYLGRAESVCEARLLDGDVAPDGTWWQPSPAGAETVRLLAPARPVRRALLELGTVEIRKGRRTMPPETEWVTYARAETEPAGVPARRPAESSVEAVRFAVVARAPFKATNGVLLADEVHRLVTRKLDGGRSDVLGHGGATTDHRHSHWVPIASGTERDATVEALLVWVPAGLTTDEVARVIAVGRVSGRRGGGEDAYEIKGFPDTDLLLQAVGPVATLAPELCGPARVWRSLTPYLPVRHRKRETLDEFVAKDVRTELGYRGVETEVVVSRWSRDPLCQDLERQRLEQKR